jgi:hypothetical protein
MNEIANQLALMENVPEKSEKTEKGVWHNSGRGEE